MNHYRVLVYLGGEMAPANVMVIDAEHYENNTPAAETTAWLRFYDANDKVVAEFNGDRIAVVQRIDADEAKVIRAEAALLRAQPTGAPAGFGAG
jgi:hypothetical protein